MGKIHDPHIDAMFRNGQPPQPAGPVIAAPINDIQLVALLGSIIGASSKEEVAPNQAVATAIELVAESIVQVNSGGLNRALQASKQRAELEGAKLTLTQ